MTRRNLFIAPYFDDFEQEGGAKEQNYHRILFRPGFAVQGRELTQSQTILQDQVRRFGNNIFQDGSLVTGGGFHAKNNIPYVKVEETFDNSNESVEFDSIEDDLIGNTIRGNTSGVEAEVIDLYQDGSDRFIFVNYTRSGGSDGQNKTFFDDEAVLVEDFAQDMRTVDDDATGKGVRFKIDEGVVYTRGFFVNFPEMSVIVSPDNPEVNAEVGFEVGELFATAEEDGNLLDIATGSPNFNSPGAHRLQITMDLVSRDLGEVEDDEDFIPLLRFEGGVATHKRDTPQYNEIRKERARQTYDLHGHVAVEQFDVTLKEHLDTGNNGGVFEDGDHEKLVARVSPGRAYVAGFEVQNDITRNVVFDKATETEQIDDAALTFSLGNYFRVENTSGAWCRSCLQVGLYDATQEQNLDSPSGTKIGEAKFYILQFESEDVYRVYLFDIQMESGSIRDVRGLRADEDGDSAGSVADIILDDGQAELKDTNLRSLVYRLPESSVASLRDENGDVNADFEYMGRFIRTFSNGNVSVILSESGEEFPFGVGSLASAEISTILVFDKESGEKKEISSVEQTDSTTLEINLDDGDFSDEAAILCRVRRTNARETRKAIRPSRYVKINAEAGKTTYNLGFSDVFKLEKVTMSTEDFDPDGTDVTDWFRLDNGQRDMFYDHGKLRLRDGRQLNGDEKLLVRLAYFEPDFSEGLGYFSINSYPIDDTTDDPNSIRTWDVPVYRSRDGQRFRLQDSVDFRNIMENTANDATSVEEASEDPEEGSEFIEPPGGIRNIVPLRSFSTAMRYYLPYYVTLSIDKDGEFEITRSNASENPSAPKAPKQNMILATIRVNQYPSLAPRFAKSINKEDQAVKSRVFTHKIFTDSDVNNIEKRLENLEREVSLNALEREADVRRYTDEESGIERFKNGFVTDNFQDHDLGDFEADGYNAAISSRTHTLLPAFETVFIDMELTDAENSS